MDRANFAHVSVLCDSCLLLMIIQSLLDTDLYKFSMMQLVLHRFSAAQVEYGFKCRTPGVDLQACLDEIRHEVSLLCKLRFRPQELDYLRGLSFLKSDFVDFLALFKLRRQCIEISHGAGQGEISITIKGPWLHVILFEIPVLAIVNEVYFRRCHPKPELEQGRARLAAKIDSVMNQPGLESFRLAEYGTRRRFSGQWHHEVVQTLQASMGSHFVGTSNVLIAMQQGLAPVGTMGHEYLQACQVLGPSLRDSQCFAFDTWAKEFRGELGIALSDVYGLDAFLRDFDLYFCKLFDGARHDSGDPFVWGERLIAHYEANRVDPRTKTLVFSDSLTFPKAIKIAKQFAGRCKVAFGIGTNLTNDLGVEPLQIVIKMLRCNGQPVAKVSDAPEKTMCDDLKYLSYLRHVFDLPSVTVVSRPNPVI